MVRAALLQMTTGIDPGANGKVIVDAVAAARTGGAEMLFTPEMSGLLDRQRDRARSSIRAESEDTVLIQVREAARRHGMWVHNGSLAVRRPGGTLAHRAFGHSIAVDPWGEVILDMGGALDGRGAGLGFVDVDHARIAEVRSQLPSLANRRPVAT